MNNFDNNCESFVFNIEDFKQVAKLKRGRISLEIVQCATCKHR